MIEYCIGPEAREGKRQANVVGWEQSCGLFPPVCTSISRAATAGSPAAITGKICRPEHDPSYSTVYHDPDGSLHGNCRDGATLTHLMSGASHAYCALRTRVRLYAITSRQSLAQRGIAFVNTVCGDVYSLGPREV